MKPTTAPNWICARIEPLKERFAEGNSKKALRYVYCPQVERRTSHSPRRRLPQRCLLQNHFFMRADAGIEGPGAVKRAAALSALAARELASSCVLDTVIEWVRANVDSSGVVVLIAERFKTREAVRLKTWPFVGFEGLFAEKHDDRRCRILLSMLEKQHFVLVLSHFLEKTE